MSTAAGQDRARNATIFDVARLAGVSHQTVSRVLNGLPNVRPSTRERVERAIKQLRYVPSQAARSLVTRRSRTLGLIATGLPDFGPSSVVTAFSEAAREADYAVIAPGLGALGPENIRSSAEMLIRQNVEAVVLMAADRSSVDALDGFELGVPLVVMASERRGGATRVSLDQYEGARRAVQHLLAYGHERIHHIAGPEGSMDAEERVRGWRDALAQAHVPASGLVRGDWSARSGFELARVLLAGKSSPTAVFCGNDQMALGLLRAVDETGMSVPQDLSVVGFDDIPDAAFFSPPLTTVRQDFIALGRDALAAALKELEDGPGQSLPVARIPQLIERASVDRPPGRPAGARGDTPAGEVLPASR